MIKILFSPFKKGKIELIAENDEDEEKLRMFAYGLGVKENEFCAKNTSITLSSPVISGGMKSSRAKLDIVIQTHS